MQILSFTHSRMMEKDQVKMEKRPNEDGKRLSEDGKRPSEDGKRPTEDIPSSSVSVPFDRTIFPSDFLFGVASSAYQIEGAWNADGKGPSIWDTFTHKYPERIIDRSNGDITLDFYQRYEEDIELVKLQGFDSFRFSIAWSRILPKGKLSKGINWAGINFYKNVITKIVTQGITPFVTLFHWDTPQALEDEYGGFLNSTIVNDYVDYVNICFEHFGDKVKYWTTFNEPYVFSVTGYDYGAFAPDRCSQDRYCANMTGNSGTEPYIVGHNLLLAHAAAVSRYRRDYQAKQKGQIGIVHHSEWFEPCTKKAQDVLASRRALDFMLGWFLHPVIYGDYPDVMKVLLGKRLPKFKPGEKDLLEGSFDFIGLNYYTSHYAANPSSTPRPKKYGPSADSRVISQTHSTNGAPIGDSAGESFVVPWGFRKLLVYVNDTYNNPTIYVTECGMHDISFSNDAEGVNDNQRVDFYKDHILEMHEAYKQGVNVRGFFGWSFHDNFEWYYGYTKRFGINFIDYNNNLKRCPKRSALWLKEFLLK